MMQKRKRVHDGDDSDETGPNNKAQQWIAPSFTAVNSSTGGALETDRPLYRGYIPYRPLERGYIRVLVLRPGTLNSPLSASLEHVKLDRNFKDTHDCKACEACEAISYAWGPPVFDHEIHIEPAGRLNITKSLYWALQHLRYEDRARRLWADAICINQLDGKEKSHQVSRMFEIFQNASQVLVWLGSEEPSDDIAFATINAYLEPAMVKYCGPNGYDYDEEYGTLRRILEGLAPEPVDVMAGLLAASRLFARSWWTRLWVVQEKVSHDNGREVMIISGRLQASWKNFEQAIFLCHHSCVIGRVQWPAEWTFTEIEFSDAVSTLNEVFGIRLAHKKSLAMALNLLVECRSRRCLDSRDRIYALYGWLRLSTELGSQPDYTIGVIELYRRFVAALCTRAPDRTVHSMLAMIGTEAAEAEHDQRPSWVPHFHHLTHRSRGKYEATQGIGYSPQEQFGPQYPLGDPSSEAVVRLNYLKLRGRCFGTVSDVMLDTGWPERVEDFDQLPRVTSWYHTCKKYFKWFTYPHGTALTSESRLQHGLLSLFTAGSMPSLITRVIMNQKNNGDKTISQSAASFDDLLISELCDTIQDRHRGNNGQIVANHVDLERYLGLVTINEGSTDLSWLPKSAQVGDRLCALKGGRFPFLLRESREGCFTLLGDAWTFRITLQEALGGDHKCQYPADCRDVEWDSEAKRYRWADCNKWDSEDEGMERLIADLDWITLE